LDVLSRNATTEAILRSTGCSDSPHSLNETWGNIDGIQFRFLRQRAVNVMKVVANTLPIEVDSIEAFNFAHEGLLLARVKLDSHRLCHRCIATVSIHLSSQLYLLELLWLIL
jgi:hypothetical protein